MDAKQQRRTRDIIQSHTMPYTLARAVMPYLKQTPEYETARREQRSREWLDRESLSLGHALAEVTQQRLTDLDS